MTPPKKSGNEKARDIIAKWIKKDWLIRWRKRKPEEVVLSVCALQSCEAFDGNVVIVSNKNGSRMMLDSISPKYQRIYNEFLETKMCRISVFRDKPAAKRRKLNPKGGGTSYIDESPEFKLRPPLPYVIKPQFYRFPTGESENKECLVWCVPYCIDEEMNLAEVRQHCHPEAIVKNMIRWLVVKLQR